VDEPQPGASNNLGNIEIAPKTLKAAGERPRSS
jgi:hypothetical protein